MRSASYSSNTRVFCSKSTLLACICICMLARNTRVCALLPSASRSFAALRHRQNVPRWSRFQPSLTRALSSAEHASKSNKDKDAQKGIRTRDEDYSSWYQDVIAAAEMADSSPVKGCMVIRPWGMAIWEALRDDLDKRIRAAGVQNAYFPLFIPQSFLSKEAEHVEGFAKECAVVTHHRLCKSPDGRGLIPDPEAKLEEPLVVRPTSETMIWNMFSKWITSYRDLPLKLNQWANVVRWEMRTRPFLRSSEFLWQEGHTAHATAEEALQCAQQMLDVYASVCKDMLAIPMIKGTKSPSERFAGADETLTIEACMQNGWALQSGTSHYLGQNFAKAFDVTFQTSTGERELVYATSWGVSTRLIGALVMTHADDKGLVLPPPVAPVQCVIVPITKGQDQTVAAAVNTLETVLQTHGVRVKVDWRDHMRPGAKYFEWERKGVPLRIDIGPRDVAKNTVALVYRHTGEKVETNIADAEAFAIHVKNELHAIHEALYHRAEQMVRSKTFRGFTYDEMKQALDSAKKEAGLFLVPWHEDPDNEARIKEDCKATLRCYPMHAGDLFGEPLLSIEGQTCFYSGKPATHWAIFARAF